MTEARLTAVEQSILRVDVTLAGMREQMATKFDLAELRAETHKGFAEQTKWIIGTAVGGVAVFITVMTFVLNNATPRPPAQTLQPTVIVVPAAPAPALPAPPAK